MEAVCSFKMFVHIFRITECCIPEDKNLNVQCFPDKKLFRGPVKKKSINGKISYKGNVK
jgi:hypothetical protein